MKGRTVSGDSNGNAFQLPRARYSAVFALGPTGPQQVRHLHEARALDLPLRVHVVFGSGYGRVASEWDGEEHAYSFEPGLCRSAIAVWGLSWLYATDRGDVSDDVPLRVDLAWFAAAANRDSCCQGSDAVGDEEIEVRVYLLESLED